MAKAATASVDGTSGFRSESHQLQASNYAPPQSWGSRLLLDHRLPTRSGHRELVFGGVQAFGGFVQDLFCVLGTRLDGTKNLQVGLGLTDIERGSSHVFRRDRIHRM